MDAACNGAAKRIGGNIIWREQRGSCICWVDFHGRHHKKSQEGTHFNSRHYSATKFVNSPCKVLPQSVRYYADATKWWWYYCLQTLEKYSSEPIIILENIACTISVIVLHFQMFLYLTWRTIKLVSYRINYWGEINGCDFVDCSEH